jgi:hypothetical protein
LLLPSKNTVLTHRMLALRHVTPEWELWSNRKLLCGNLLKTGG